MNSESFVSSLMIHGDCFCCRDSACWLTLNCTLRVRRRLHKCVTVDTDQTPTSMSMEKQNTERTKCRQNSNLLITYLFFTFVREECGGGWQRLPGWLPLERGLLYGGGNTTLFFPLTLTNKNCISQSFPWRGEVNKASYFVHMSETFNPFAHIRIIHISLQRSRKQMVVHLLCGAKLKKKNPMKTGQRFGWLFFVREYKKKNSLGCWVEIIAEFLWRIMHNKNHLSAKVRQTNKVTLICERVGAKTRPVGCSHT